MTHGIPDMIGHEEEKPRMGKEMELRHVHCALHMMTKRQSLPTPTLQQYLTFQLLSSIYFFFFFLIQLPHDYKQCIILALTYISRLCVYVYRDKEVNMNGSKEMKWP